jgi:hypothetical protein
MTITDWRKELDQDNPDWAKLIPLTNGYTHSPITPMDIEKNILGGPIDDILHASDLSFTYSVRAKEKKASLYWLSEVEKRFIEMQKESV